MENATKALIIAGSILLGMMVLAIGIYFAQNLRKTSDSYVTTLEIVELDKYNSNFNSFIGRTNVTAQEIATAIGFAQEKDGQTSIFVDGMQYTNSETFLANNTKNEFEYSNIEYNSEGKIIKIKFIKK